MTIYVFTNQTFVWRIKRNNPLNRNILLNRFVDLFAEQLAQLDQWIVDRLWILPPPALYFLAPASTMVSLKFIYLMNNDSKGYEKPNAAGGNLKYS